jgi:hypothetical protein
MAHRAGQRFTFTFFVVGESKSGALPVVVSITGPRETNNYRSYP